MEERRPANLADLLKSRFDGDPGAASPESRPSVRPMSEDPPRSLFRLPNPYLSFDIQQEMRRQARGETMADMVTLRNATRRAILVGAHFLLPGHTVTLERTGADEARKRHPGGFDILNESGVVVTPIQVTTLDEVLAEAASLGATAEMNLLEQIRHDAQGTAEVGGEGGSGFGPATESEAEAIDNGNSPERLDPAPRKRGARPGRSS